MNQLLFDILPIDFILERSKNYLNKNYQYLIGELKDKSKVELFKNELLDLEKHALENNIADIPINWYVLDILKTLLLFKPDENKIEFIKNLFEQVTLNNNSLGISNLQFESNGFEYNIPLNLNDILGLHFGDNVVFNQDNQYHRWEPNFIKALEIIRSVNLQILYDINPLVKNVLVIESKDDSHGSMSPKNIMGSVYLPDVEDSTLIAECFVHECLHQYLYRLDHVSSIFNNNEGNEELYYSPWKEEPRPLNMVLHGAFVFTGVMMFYHELCKKDLPNNFIKTFKERIAYRYTQVNIALTVLANNNKFSKFGNDIFGILKGYLDDIHNSEYFDNSMQIDSALDHLSKFANKDYKHVSI